MPWPGPACSCSRGRPVPGRPASWTPSASALFGQVPGARGTARGLRSDHAADGVRPAVVLEVSLRGRRLRVTRSPAWERPKRRGSGTTTEQARVHLEERTGSCWHTLSTRLDEAGHEIDALLGLSLAQFCQVVLLPQGQFADFLRADAERRRTLLESPLRHRPLHHGRAVAGRPPAGDQPCPRRGRPAAGAGAGQAGRGGWCRPPGRPGPGRRRGLGGGPCSSRRGPRARTPRPGRPPPRTGTRHRRQPWRAPPWWPRRTPGGPG
jgi:exonuclease SbcC